MFPAFVAYYVVSRMGIPVASFPSPFPDEAMPKSIRNLLTMIPLAFLLNGAPATADEIRQSPADDRAYEVMTLANGLRVLLVSDPDTDMAAAALNVNVGYYNDPADRPGLAHFLEHMLFLGTGKYPEPDAYREFVIAHGGGTNAMTMAENTAYFFDVERDHLEGALDRFAQFFVAPLFSEQYVAREMQAVESEYRLRLRDDARRLNDAVKETINPAHPYAKFSTGNIETLGDRDDGKARAAVIEFYERHYSADLMTLVVIGAEPLERLRDMVRPRFEPVVRREGARPPTVDVPVVEPGTGPMRLDVVPFKEQRALRLEFPFPWREEYMVDKPAVLLGHLIGHEGKGSLHDVLEERGWITRISAGAARLADNEGIFRISFDLTEEGVGHSDDIVAQVFRYIELISSEGIRASYHDELVRMNTLEFLHREKAPPRSEVVALAASLHVYPEPLVLAGPYHLGPFDEAAVREILAHLEPGNVRLTLVAPGLETDAESRWYATPYRLRPIGAETVAGWKAARPLPQLALPAENVFLPRHARVKRAEEARERPELLLAREGLSIWHLQDTQFLIPKADLFVSIETPAVVESARGSALGSLFLTLVQDSLNPHTYAAGLAGLRYGLTKTARGFGFSISGYDEKKPLLVELVIERLLEPEFDAGTFEVRRAELMRHWQNAALNAPYTQLLAELDLLLYGHRFAPEAMRAALEDVTPGDLHAFVEEALSRVRVEVFTHGNLTAAESRALGLSIAERVFERAEPGEAVTREVARLPAGSQFLRTVESSHDDTAVLVYYQADDATVETAARMMMIEQVVKSPFFDELRTRQQLGYVVAAQGMSALRVPGLNFLVQSPAQGSKGIFVRIDRFLEEFRDRLAAMDADEFDRYRQGLLAMLREKDPNLGRRSRRLQADLALGEYGFDRRERMISAVEALDRDDVLAFYEEQILAADRRRRIILQATGNGHRHEALAGDESLRPIERIPEFRAAAAPAFRIPGGEVPETVVAVEAADAGDERPSE